MYEFLRSEEAAGYIEREPDITVAGSVYSKILNSGLNNPFVYLGHQAKPACSREKCRGWDEIAQVKATSVIDTVAVDAIIENGDQQLVPIGGIAFSGDRGISKVEVRVDDGPWEAAMLRSPLSETTWVMWRFDWPFEAGEHSFEVRCAEGDGTLQIEESEKSRPSGATGIHSRSADL